MVAPYLSVRPESERGLYALLGALLVAKSIALLLGRRWPAPVVQLVAVVPDVVITVILLTLSSQVGVLPMLLLVCVRSAVTVRVIAERGDHVMRRLDERASSDGMTGLLNRRGFVDALDALWAADRHGPLTVTFFDLDHFKAINDTYGHTTGDAVLRAVAGVPSRSSGQDDVVGRTGGEELAMATAGRDAHAAHRRAVEIVERVAGLRVPSAAKDEGRNRALVAARPLAAAGASGTDQG
ncbi:GGDEF domain-containing protein [Cellulomonas sp. KRMCY2]|uniref:GGDEF domain-containing protein n=1 Tax=Cellulomonas sp. KRMCY2 TaxID=1304865 RepID=UPI0012DE6D30|nr:GGDEF domain-containing protein [Cellulomonas sp. KRMCY2]